VVLNCTPGSIILKRVPFLLVACNLEAALAKACASLR
jgi:hypothetical protein